MKKFLLPVIVVLGFAGYFLSQIFGGNNSTPVTSDSALPTTDATSPVVSPQTSSKSSTTPQQTKSQTGYKDGSYVGSVADAIYGPVQVKAIISSGKLTDVQVLQYPNSKGHSVEVSNYSLPILRSEAIQSQGTKVDIVSGATQTSEGFIQSLNSALAKARS